VSDRAREGRRTQAPAASGGAATTIRTEATEPHPIVALAYRPVLVADVITPLLLEQLAAI